MSLVSAVPGTTVSASIPLPRQAGPVVQWRVLDYQGNLVVAGQVAGGSVNVALSFTLPSGVPIAPDGSKYALSVSDGNQSATEYFSVVSPVDLEVQHGTEVAYMAGGMLRDSLILPREAQSVSVVGSLVSGQVILPTTDCSTSMTRRGDAYAYSLSGPTVNTQTASTLGNGTLVWTFSYDGTDQDFAIHSFYTVTPYTAEFMQSIRKLVDRARMGDSSGFLEVTTSDLCHALIRGAEFVMQAEPLSTTFTLDGMPRALKDYIVKAGAIDLLRGMVLAEGMSEFDLQGLGAQLTVERTQFLNGLIEQLQSDLQGLPQAKNRWLEQGAPMGGSPPPGRRPIGHLLLTTGIYAQQPMRPIPFRMMGSGLYSFLGGGYGPSC